MKGKIQITGDNPAAATHRIYIDDVDVSHLVNSVRYELTAGGACQINIGFLALDGVDIDEAESTLRTYEIKPEALS